MEEKAELSSSASNGALFKEDMPSKMHIGGKIEKQEDDTLMGRLAKRMSSRDFIAKQRLGDFKAPEADTADNAGDSNGAELYVPERIAFNNPVSSPDYMFQDPELQNEYSMGMQTESKEHSEMPEVVISQLVVDHLKQNPKYYSEEAAKDSAKGMGLHQHSTSNAFNSLDPNPVKGVRAGANMADQAKAAGNVYGVKYN